MLKVLKRDMTRNEIMAALGIKNEKHFRQHYQQAGIAAGVIEMTSPDKVLEEDPRLLMRYDQVVTRTGDK